MPSDFILKVNRFTKETKETIDAFATEFPQEIALEIVENTPVKTGNLRASWHWIRSGRIWSFVNATFYGPFVEFGTSRMAPRAFVRSVIARSDEIARRVLARVKKGK